jgi:hypothetical protein
MKQRLKKSFAGAGLQPGPHVYCKAVIYHGGSGKMTKLSETHGSIYKIEPAKMKLCNKMKQCLKKTFAGAGLQPGHHVYHKAIIYYCGSGKMTKLSETHGSTYKIEPAKKTG